MEVATATKKIDMSQDDKNSKERLNAAKDDLRAALESDPLLMVRGVLTENETLKDLAKANHQKFLVTALMLILSVVAAIAGWSRDEQFRYFYINSKGHVYETRGMTYPTATMETVKNFAEDVATKLHTWTYRNYADNFTELFDYCVNDEINRYYSKLGNDKVFGAAERYKQRYESIATGAQIKQERVIDSDGRMEWRINLTVQEEILGATNPVRKTYDVVIDVRQVPLSVSPRGLQCTRIDENYKS